MTNIWFALKKVVLFIPCLIFLLNFYNVTLLPFNKSLIFSLTIKQDFGLNITSFFRFLCFFGFDVNFMNR